MLVSFAAVWLEPSVGIGGKWFPSCLYPGVDRARVVLSLGYPGIVIQGGFVW